MGRTTKKEVVVYFETRSENFPVNMYIRCPGQVSSKCSLRILQSIHA